MYVVVWVWCGCMCCGVRVWVLCGCCVGVCWRCGVGVVWVSTKVYLNFCPECPPPGGTIVHLGVQQKKFLRLVLQGI